jgi:hypothetical protein
MKHKDHQRREDEVANLLSTWMSEISTNLEKNGHHLLSKMLWGRRSPSSVKWLARAQEGRKMPIYRRHVSTGWWLQPVLDLST